VPEKPGHFFDHISVRGYTQVRYNQLFANNERLVNLQGDRSMGQNAGFLIRRARLVLSGDIHPQIAMYLQTDSAAASGDNLHYVQIRDWYFDVALDPDKELRFRVGQSKVPYGFENPQSSQNRLPMDRSDALNSAVAGERDLGVFFYYAPKDVRKTFKHLTDSGLKGSGDYGMVGLGVYEGQTINLADTNKGKHVVARITYPFQIGEQYIEAGLSGYTGKYVVRTDPGIVSAPEGVRDARAVAHFVLYPQPFGLQLEYNIGDGPEIDALTATTDADGETSYTGVVRRKRLHGGYALASLKLDNVIPYVRAMYYEGGKKHERNAPRYDVREIEGGIEWQVLKAFELTGAFTYARRSDGGRIPYDLETGRLVRLQAQFNY
jgi:phosphate-selective porin O/P